MYILPVFTPAHRRQRIVLSRFHRRNIMVSAAWIAAKEHLIGNLIELRPALQARCLIVSSHLFPKTLDIYAMPDKSMKIRKI